MKIFSQHCKKKPKKNETINFYYIPAGNYMFKVNNRNTRTRCEICSTINMFNNKDTRMMPLASFWCLYCELWTYFLLCFSVSIVNFELVNVCWVETGHKTVILQRSLTYFDVVRKKRPNIYWHLLHICLNQTMLQLQKSTKRFSKNNILVKNCNN